MAHIINVNNDYQIINCKPGLPLWAAAIAAAVKLPSRRQIMAAGHGAGAQKKLRKILPALAFKRQRVYKLALGLWLYARGAGEDGAQPGAAAELSAAAPQRRPAIVRYY